MAFVSGFAALVPPKTSHHSKKIVRRGKFSSLADTPELRSARETWMAALRPFAPSRALRGPIEARLTFLWPWRKADSVGTRKHGCAYSTVKPDLENVAKTVIDVMVVLGFLIADQEISRLTLTKFFTEKPGLEFFLQETITPAERIEPKEP